MILPPLICWLRTFRKVLIVPYLVWAALVFMGTLSWAMMGPRWLVDSDCYNRLSRLRMILFEGAYPFQVLSRVNPPTGETMMYNLPLDLLIIPATGLARIFVPDWDAALYFAGVWISPFLFLVSLALLGGVVTAKFGWVTGFLCCLLTVGNPSINNWYIVARPDHHSLIHLCFVGSIMAFTQWQQQLLHRKRLSMRWVCLFFTAFGFWASIEASVLAAFIGITLGILYAFDAHETEQRRDDLIWYSGMLGIALLFAFLIEHGWPCDFAWAMDSLSLRHSLPLLIFAGLLFLSAGHQGTRRSRWKWLFIAGAASIGTFLLPSLWAGDVFKDPHFQIPWELMAAFTSDMRGLASHEQKVWLMTLYWWGLPFFLLPYTAPKWLKSSRLNPASKWFWLILTLAYAGLSLLQMRWCQYAATGSVVIAAAVLSQDIRRFAGNHKSRNPASFLRSLALGVCIILVLPPRLIWAVAARPSDLGFEPNQIDPFLPIVGQTWTADRALRGDSSLKVLCPMMLGPAVAYQWKAEVLATPYPRNGLGITKALDWFLRLDTSAALEEIVAAGWHYAIVPTTEDIAEIRNYARLTGFKGDLKDTLLGQLAGPGASARPGVKMLAEILVDKEKKVSVRLFRLDSTRP